MFSAYQKNQPIAYKIFYNAIINNKYNHAYLIEKNGYDEAYNFIIDFVKEIFTYNKNEKKKIYEMIDTNNFPELRIINPDGSWIKKEQMIDLQQEFKSKSLLDNKKIYIINNADRLNDIAANSILKFLEEPQENIIALLLCDNRYQMINTIISRCQIISLNGQADYNINFDFKHKIGQMITRNKEEYEKFLEEENDEKINAAIDMLKYFETNKTKTLYYINKYWNNHFQNKESYYLGLSTMMLFYKDVLNYKLNRKIALFNNYDLEKISFKNSIKDLIRKIKIINNSIYKLDYNANLNLLMDKLIIEMDGA